MAENGDFIVPDASVPAEATEPPQCVTSDLLSSSAQNIETSPDVVPNKDSQETAVNKDPSEDLQKEIRRLQTELDEARSLVAVANYSLEESLETERRKCQEEVATLQQLMKGINLFYV